MPRVAKGKRKRAFGPKTSTGCLTCRVRRVKCDEARPACIRCTSTRRACDGYSHALPPAAVVAGPSLDIHDSWRCKRSYSFFVLQTRPQLAGFFGSDFWEKLVLQAAHHEPAVRHALVAIGSAHEMSGHRSKTVDVDCRTFALEQYNLAIRALLGPLARDGERAVDVCLISCILFACFEHMQGRSIKPHIQSGVKLLRETIYDGRTGLLRHQLLGERRHVDSYAPLEVLARIFIGLNPQAAVIMRDYKLKRFENFLSLATSDGISIPFDSVEEARDFFEFGYCLFTSDNAAQLSSSTTDTSTIVEPNMIYYGALIAKFSRGLQDFITKRGASLTASENIAIAVLQLHVLNTSITFQLEHLPPNWRSSPDELIPQMRQMTALGEKIVASISCGDPLGEQPTSFCLDTGFIIPLYTVATQCPDYTIRREAIAILRSTSRQEGIWNSFMIANVAERIMEIEESEWEESSPGSPGSPAGSSRAQPVLELDGRGGRLQYVRQVSGANPQDSVVEEVFSW